MFRITVVALLVLVSVARSDDLQYQSVSFKGPIDAQLNEKLVFGIPDGQCSGDVDKSLLCNNRKPLAMRLEVRDSRAFPLAHIDHFEEVQVQRVPDHRGHCPGHASVSIQLDCRAL